MVSAKHVARGKPAPDVYLEALRRLGCTNASRALVVEDAGGPECREWDKVGHIVGMYGLSGCVGVLDGNTSNGSSCCEHHHLYAFPCACKLDISPSAVATFLCSP